MNDPRNALDQNLTAALRGAQHATYQRRKLIGAGLGVSGLCAGVIGLMAVMSTNDKALAQTAQTLEVAPAISPIVPPSANEYILASYKEELNALTPKLSDAQAEAAKYEGSLVGSLAAARAAQIQLSQAMIRNLILSQTSGTPVELTVPAIAPDQAKADKLQIEIAAIDEKLKHDQAEADRYSGGLVLAMIISRIETQRLQRAQLHGGWIEAAYGIPMTVASIRATEPASGTPAAIAVPEDPAVAPWADPAHPEINYYGAAFVGIGTEDYIFRGWWAVKSSRAAIDDSAQVVAINLSQYESGYGDQQMLIMRCSEREPAIVYLPDNYLSLDYRSKQGKVTYRLGSGQAVDTYWSSLTNNKGVGVFGHSSYSMMQKFSAVETAFVRVSEKDGERHDATFNMAGTPAVVEMVKDACL